MRDHDQINSGRPDPGRSGPGQSGSGSGPAMSRRAVVAGTGIVAAAAALTACSSYGSGQGGSPATGGAYSGAQPSAAPPGGGEPLAETADIPVGGGVIFADKEIVVTQPIADQFRAFSAVCTHQQCLVNKVENGTIDCPCHGSKFAVADGTPVDGPAKTPLPPRQVEVEGTSIRLV